MANTNRSSGREAYWRDVVARLRASGLSVRAFCRREQLPESAFYFWRRTLADRDGEVRSKRRQLKGAAPAPAFLPVTLRRDVLPSTSGLALELPSGAVLRFSEATSADRIAALVKALAAEARV